MEPTRTWTAHPNGARWYGEVIFEDSNDFVGHNYGYSNDADPDPVELVPPGATILGTDRTEIHPLDGGFQS